MNNILICSAGRRVELVNAFREQAQLHLEGAKVFAIDFRAKLSSACHAADESSSCPRVTDPEYLDFLLNYALRNQVGLIIPTIDTELILLARSKKQFKEKGINILISSENLILMCRDKRKTDVLFRKLGIDCPAIYRKDEISFPCFVKPYDGSCSVGARAVMTEEQMTEDLLNDEKMMFMELVGKSYSEVTVDAYYYRGQLKCLVPRKRLEVRAGEISKGVTIKSWVYEFLLDRLMLIEGAAGCLTIQVFVNDETHHCLGLEINPRFGGGYPLAYAAGANYPGWSMREHSLSEEPEFYDAWQENLLMLRYDSKILIPDFSES